MDDNIYYFYKQMVETSVIFTNGGEQVLFLQMEGNSCYCVQTEGNKCYIHNRRKQVLLLQTEGNKCYFYKLRETGVIFTSFSEEWYVLQSHLSYNGVEFVIHDDLLFTDLWMLNLLAMYSLHYKLLLFHSVQRFIKHNHVNENRGLEVVSAHKSMINMQEYD